MSGDAVITPAFKMTNAKAIIFGGSLDNPVAESTKQCLRAYKKFTADYPEYEVDVKLCAFTVEEMKEAEQEYGAFKQEN